MARQTYNNNCYESCPINKYISSTNDYVCVDSCNNYYDYNKIKCLDKIPDGYYLNNSDDKTIDKCNIKCKLCTHESVLNNNYCISCNIENNYYPIFNNSSFVNCSNQILEGYY